jgi:hypothetical protein
MRYAKNYCSNSISFIFITDITDRGFNKSLVASDGLHPSELAYFICRTNVPTATTAFTIKKHRITKPQRYPSITGYFVLLKFRTINKSIKTPTTFLNTFSVMTVKQI